MIVWRNKGWLAARVADELLMMSAEKGLYLGLNAVGARIWDLIEDPCETSALCAQLVREYEIAPDSCHAEVDAFLEQLASHGAIDRDAAPAA
jgi:hypothetical protein